MNISHRPPSKEALAALAALQSAVTKTLEKKQRLGHYAVVRKNGEVTEKHFNDSTSIADFQHFLLDKCLEISRHVCNPCLNAVFPVGRQMKTHANFLLFT